MKYDRREVDQLATLAGDRHGLDHDVDGVLLQRGDPVGRGQDPVLHRRRPAEDVAGHLAGDVDVEPGDLAGDRVAEGEQVASDVQAHQQPAALPGSSRPRRRRRLWWGRAAGWRSGRSRSSAGAALRGRRGSSSIPAGVGGASVGTGGGSTVLRRRPAAASKHSGQGDVFAGALMHVSVLRASAHQLSVLRASAHAALSVLRASAHHRYSLILGHSPSATATAAPTDSNAPPTVVPDSTRRADRMSERSCVRLS